MSNPVIRYSDADLEEFRVLIEKKLDRAKEQLDLLQSQILEMTENSDSDYGADMMDDSNTNTDVEMLNNLAIHQRKYLRELESALARIRNKSYGICEVTGELIDKKRLLAVPTTTKSLAAKMGTVAPPKAGESEEEEETVPPRPSAPPQRQVITRVIRKSTTKTKPEKEIPEDADEEDLINSEWIEEEEEENEEVPFSDMDEFADDDSDV